MDGLTCAFIGRVVGQGAEVRFTSSGTPLVNLTVLVQDSKAADGEGQFCRIGHFGDDAEDLAGAGGARASPGNHHQRGGVTEDSRVRRHRFLGKSIDLPADLNEAQLDGRACIRCGAEDQPMLPTEAWSEQSAQLFECTDAFGCAVRRGECGQWRRGPIRPDDSQQCLDCGVVFVSDS